MIESITFVLGIPLFAFLSKEELPQLALAFTTARYYAGAVVVQQGEPGHQFFIVKEGRAAVQACQEPEAEPAQVAELFVGDYFGEEVLVGNWHHDVSVVAIDDLEIWVLDREDFQRLGLTHKLHFKRRTAVVEGCGDVCSIDPALLEKTAAEEEMLRKALMSNKNLRPLLGRMGPQKAKELVDNAYRLPVHEGEVVIEQGELKVDLFYMITRGRFEVSVCGRKVQELGPGGSFGELALLYREARSETVRAATDGTLWAVPQQHFREVVRDQVRVKLAEFTKLLYQVDLLKELSNEDRQYLADRLVETTFYANEYIIRQGQEGRTFYILYEGEVAVEIDGKEVRRLSGDPRAGRAEFFGERSLLTDQPRSASVRAASKKAMFLALDRDTFENMLLRDEANLQHKFARRLSFMEKVTYSLDRLEHVGLLGSGAFGSVTLVKDTQTGQHYALKAMSKGLLVQMERLKAVKMEKLVLQMTRSPFLIRLAATFNTEQYLHFLLEAALGGELFTVYRRHSLFGSEAHARFYAACTIRALEHLHERKIIYRDLKTENMLLDSKGYCKITDFGLSTFAPGHTYTFCGTPDYMAPEVLSGSGHTCAVDWWGLGVLIYECMVGAGPFYAESSVLIFHKVSLGMEHVKFPHSDGEGQLSRWPDLVCQLCVHQPSERLPMRPEGLAGLLQHEWFAVVDFDWAAHQSCQLLAPYVPQALQEGDLSQFDAYEADRPREVFYNDTGDAWDKAFHDPRGPRFH